MKINKIIRNTFFIIYIFFIVLSGKVVKSITGFNSSWINPQFILGFILLLYVIIKYGFKVKRIKIYVYSILLIFIYFLSYYISIFSNTQFYYGGINTIFKVLFDIFFIFFVVINLNLNCFKQFLKDILYIGIIEIIFEIYGILVFLNIFSAPSNLKEYIILGITSQQWFSIGNLTLEIPKWGVTFPETQMLSLFYFICYFICVILIKYNIYDSKVNRRSLNILRYIFFIAIIYNLSKSVLIAFLLFNIFIYINRYDKIFRKVVYIISIFIIIYILYLMGYKELSNIKFSNIIYYGSVTAGSFSERIFHFIMGLHLMSNSIKNILFGIGPRQYGIQLMSLNINSRYGYDSNAISMIQILFDIGTIGIIVFTALIIRIYKQVKRNNLLKYVLICIIIGNFMMPDYISSIFWLSLGIIIGFSNYLGIFKINT